MERKESLDKLVEQRFHTDLSLNSVVLYGRKNCMKTSELTFKLVYAFNCTINLRFIDENGPQEDAAYVNLFKLKLGDYELPIVFVKEKYIGGWHHVLPMIDSNVGTLEKLLNNELQYDICVIGGGTCGLAAAFEASKDLVVAVCDCNMSARRDNSIRGIGAASKLNMELLPKYFMHKELFINTKFHKSNKNPNKWQDLIDILQEKIANLTKENLQRVKDNHGIRYYNGKATILDSHTVRVTKYSGLSQIITAKKLIIATGTEIVEENIKGADKCGITAEQLFQLRDSPQKTLIIGDKMKCLELGGIMKALRVNCTLLPTGICGDVLDEEIIDQLTDLVRNMGVKILPDYKVSMITMDHPFSRDDSILVNGVTNIGEKYSDRFHTVVYANIRRGRTNMLGLDNVGLNVHKRSYKILAKENGETDNPSVFVTGSVLHSPHTCFENSTGVQHMINLIRSFQTHAYITTNSIMIPRVLLTPTEYGAIGETEETAVALYGPDDISIHKTNIGPAYFKFVCVKELEDRIIGMHVLAPRVADILQSLATCIIKGITKNQMETLVNYWCTADSR